MELNRLVALLDDLLDADAIEDYGPNGLQVEGRSEVERVVTGVSGSAELFRRALDEGADAVLVHHGILWNAAGAPRLVGSFRERVRLLIENDLSLIAYHLPLDRHLRVGNAALLARRVGLDELEPFGDHKGRSTGVSGVFPQPLPIEEVASRIADACDREPGLFRGSGEVRSMGIITGGAVRDYHRAVAAGLDAYVTGEVSEWVMHQAAEDGVHYLSAGHYATERFGVRELGRWLAEEHGLETTFVDLPNPV